MINYALIGLLITTMIFVPLVTACSGTNLFDADSTCSSNGYCLEDFCSCSPGFSDVTCSTNDHTGCTPILVQPDSSNFAVEILASITNGDFSLDLNLPVENSTAANRATFTSVDFLGDSTCDYPLSTSWSRSTDVNCLETFSYINTFNDSLSCFLENCYDSLDAPVTCSDSSSCVNSPCRREYSTVLTVSRGYVKEEGRVTSEGVDSSIHGITITFPWVMGAESSSLELVSIPDIASNFVIESVVYSGGSWVFTVRTSVLYPWKLSDGGAFDFTTDNAVTVSTVGLTDVSCAVNASECTQTVTVSVTGCSTLQDATTFTSSDLKYTCNSATCPNPDVHDASFSFTFDGTDSCENIDLGVTVELGMASYDPDLTTSRKSFIFGSTNQPINFKVFVETEGGDVITGMTLISVVSDAVIPGPYTVTDLSANPNCLSTESCFSIDANDIGGSTDDVVAIQDITFTATVELTFSQGEKRALSFEFYTAKTTATLVHVEEVETSQSMKSVIMATLASLVLFF